jgi:mono/diheme cytochrome c family protein
LREISRADSAHTDEWLRQAVERLTAIAFAIVINLLGPILAAAEEGAPSDLVRQGMALAERKGSVCHAIGKTAASPHAAAPAFRNLGNRVDLDDFAVGCAKA